METADLHTYAMHCPQGFDQPSHHDRNNPDAWAKPKYASGFTKHDHGKPRHSLIPPMAEREMAKVLTFGAQKYSEDNWRKVDDPSRYVDAAMRHINDYRTGKWSDDESGLHHLAHAMCCLAFVVELNIAYIDEKKAALEKSENQP